MKKLLSDWFQVIRGRMKESENAKCCVICFNLSTNIYHNDINKILNISKYKKIDYYQRQTLTQNITRLSNIFYSTWHDTDTVSSIYENFESWIFRSHWDKDLIYSIWVLDSQILLRYNIRYRLSGQSPLPITLNSKNNKIRVVNLWWWHYSRRKYLKCRWH